MTVGQKLHQTLSQAESVAASLKSFALDTQNQQSKAVYSQLAQTMEAQIINPLRNQVNSAEAQEPQYKVFQQAQQQGQTAQQQKRF
ncbi:MAG: DUF1657 domain-containing protein [Firmicutes bacterium]|nr:DUF1657 domain-containing protein [Bacillota bacterium]MCL5040104.1 DUF1657 domain-containing protein [Bacillota bacterium]